MRDLRGIRCPQPHWCRCGVQAKTDGEPPWLPGYTVATKRPDGRFDNRHLGPWQLGVTEILCLADEHGSDSCPLCKAAV